MPPVQVEIGTVELSIGRRASLVFVASIFVTGCGVLSLGFNAVPRSELATVMAAVLYVQMAHIFKPCLRAHAGAPQQQSQSNNRIQPLAMEGALRRATVRFFLLSSLILSLLVPWVWLVGFEPSQLQTKLLAPHLFLMMSQVLFEIWSYRATVSTVIRIAIPVGFVSYRLRVLVDWVRAAADVDSVAMSDRFMLVLASMNLCFWCVILFYVLLLKVCPPYFHAMEREPEIASSRSSTKGARRTQEE